MPWMERKVQDERQEFVRLAMLPSANISQLCVRFGVSRPTGYKWLARYDPRQADSGLSDRSSRPRESPNKTSAAVELKVAELRAQQPAWGARKIARLLHTEHGLSVAVSTVNAILQRQGLITAQASEAAKPWQRFERGAPNELWQIDFKGDFALEQGRCHALTVLDDHSRYGLVLKAMQQQTRPLVQLALAEAFERYGLPAQINADNGPPWGAARRSPTRVSLTQLGVWLIRLGVRLTHSRPYHPQTNGKDERFHRTLNAELIQRRRLRDLPHAQAEFDAWRDVYNHRRPHEALQLATPAQRYASSPRSMPARLPSIEYPAGDWVRKVDVDGWLSFRGRAMKMGRALAGHPVAFRANPQSATAWDVYFCDVRLTTIDLATAKRPLD